VDADDDLQRPGARPQRRCRHSDGPVERRQVAVGLEPGVERCGPVRLVGRPVVVTRARRRPPAVAQEQEGVEEPANGPPVSVDPSDEGHEVLDGTLRPLIDQRAVVEAGLRGCQVGRERGAGRQECGEGAPVRVAHGAAPPECGLASVSLRDAHQESSAR